jgi:hypothetical protein
LKELEGPTNNVGERGKKEESAITPEVDRSGVVNVTPEEKMEERGGEYEPGEERDVNDDVPRLNEAIPVDSSQLEEEDGEDEVEEVKVESNSEGEPNEELGEEVELEEDNEGEESGEEDDDTEIEEENAREGLYEGDSDVELVEDGEEGKILDIF